MKSPLIYYEVSHIHPLPFHLSCPVDLGLIKALNSYIHTNLPLAQLITSPSSEAKLH